MEDKNNTRNLVGSYFKTRVDRELYKPRICYKNPITVFSVNLESGIFFSLAISLKHGCHQVYPR